MSQIAVPRELLVELAHCVQLGPIAREITDPVKRKAATQRCEEVWRQAIKILHPGQLRGGK